MRSGRVISGVVGALLVAVGLGTLPGALENRSLAEGTDRRGTAVTVTTVETFVTRHTGKGGDYLEVGDVRVRLPGAGVGGADDWVVLTGTENPELDDDPAWIDHWIPATPATGYAPPLQVGVLQEGDERPRAMAVSDLPDWVGPDQAVFSGVFAAAGAVILGLLALLVVRERRRPTYLGG